MRRTAAYKLGLFLTIILALWAYGCGDTDLLDENDQRYTTSIAFEDAGEEWLTIDILQNPDCNADGTLDDPEFFTDVLANVTVNVAADAPGITLQRYTIEYFPIGSATGNDDIQLPPDLADPPDGFSTIPIQSGSSATFTLTCMTVSTKAECVNKVLADPNFAIGDTLRYDIRITMYFTDEYLYDRTIEVERTIYLNNYDNC